MIVAALVYGHQISKVMVPIDYLGAVKLKIQAPMQIGKWSLQLVPTPRFEERYSIRYICDRLLSDGDKCYALFQFRSKAEGESTKALLSKGQKYQTSWKQNDWEVALTFSYINAPRRSIMARYYAIGKHVVASGYMFYTADLDQYSVSHITDFYRDATKSLLPKFDIVPYLGT